MAPIKTSEKTGKQYYQQPGPEKRHYQRKVFQMRKGESDAFDADARAAGFPSAIAYLRELWARERADRGLSPWKPEQTEGPSE